MTMSKHARIWGALSLLPLLLCGCEKTNSAAENKPAAVKVEVALPVEKDVTDYRDFTGRLEAVDTVEIRARVTGYLTKVDFDPRIESGAEVKVGDLLFEVDDRPYLNTMGTATAQLAHAEASLKTSTAELSRTEELFKKKVSTQADLDRDVGNKLQAEASIQSGKAAVDQAKLDLEFTKITAPIAGRISESVPSIGDLINAQTGKLTTIVSVDPIQVYFDLDEPTLLMVQKMLREGAMKSANETRLPVSLGLAGDEGYPFEGRIDFVENQVDPDTGTIRVRGVLANPKPERGPRPLVPGLFARIRLPLGESHKALLVSERAIGRDQGSPFVYVVSSDNEVVYRRIKLGALHDGMRVILDGISVGEHVVVNGLQRIRPGVKVDPQLAKGDDARPK
jgi:RND family efflux transporter MFP subunit